MTKRIEEVIQTDSGERLSRVQIYQAPEMPLSMDRRASGRIRLICDEYLNGATLSLPRVIIEGAFWPRVSEQVLADNSLGLVICRSVDLAAAQWKDLFAEFERILAPGGICYVQAPDHNAKFDPHYRIPFLGRMPDALCEILLGLCLHEGNAVYKPLDRETVNALSNSFDVYDYTLRDLPGVPALAEGMLEYSLIKKM